jgi:hypothetical protein
MILAVGLLLTPSVTWGQVAPLRPATIPQATAEKEEEEEEKPPVGLLAEEAKPLMTLEEEKGFRVTSEREFRSALRSPAPRAAEEKAIDQGVKYRVHRLTIPENWPNISNLTKDLVNDIENFAGDENVRAREYALQASVKYLTELLDQPRIVRLNAVLLLGRLSKKNASGPLGAGRVPAVPYDPASEPLIKVLTSPDQMLEAKVAAVNGLATIMLDGEPSRALRDRIGQALVSEFRASRTLPVESSVQWYQWRIMYALGAVGQSLTMNQQAVLPDLLWEVMHDPTLALQIRTRAARSLTQLDLPADFRVDLLAHEIVKMTGIMGVEYNRGVNQPVWNLVFVDLYFSFNPQLKEDAQRGWGLLQQIKKSSLAGYAKVVNGGYAQMVKITNAVVGNEQPQQIPSSVLQEAAKWISANPPGADKLHPRGVSLKQLGAGRGDEKTSVESPPAGAEPKAG